MDHGNCCRSRYFDSGSRVGASARESTAIMVTGEYRLIECELPFLDSSVGTQEYVIRA
jgi:hypothetical protein